MNGYVAPILLGVVTWDTQMGFWPAILYFVALPASVLGPLLNQGASELERAGRKHITHEHSFNLTAAIKLLREVLDGRFDRRRYQHQVLKEVASTVDSVAHLDGVKVLACLLVPIRENLELVDWSDHRDGRIPSASIPLATTFGAALAHRTGKRQYIPDVRDVEGTEFNGKTYRAVLSYPITSDGKVLGVVTVDSTEPNHFEKALIDIDVHVRPFVDLLGFSIVEPVDEA